MAIYIKVTSRIKIQDPQEDMDTIIQEIEDQFNPPYEVIETTYEVEDSK